VLGIVERAWIDEKRRGMARITWATNDLARQVRQDVEAGVMPNISVGYAVQQAEQEGDVMRVTRWQPIELSVVSIPADASIGVNRSLPTTTQQPMTSTYETISALNPDEFGHAQRDFSVVRAIQASASGNWSQAGLEREVNQELEHLHGRRSQGFFVPQEGHWGKRDYVKGTASAGGNLVATDLLAGNFVEALRDRLAVAELGATMLSGLVGDVSIPKRTGSASSYWFGADNADAVTESTGTIAMSPKTVGCYSKFSRLMQLQATPDIEQLIRADFVALLADAIDTAAINGSGSSSQPTGILQTSGIGSVAGGTNGLAPTLDHLLDLKKEVAVDNADIGTCGFLTNSKVESVLAKAKDSQSQYLLSPYGTELGRSQIAGRRFEVSNNVPSNLTKGSGTNLSAVIYGNFADLLIGMFGQLEILVDPYTDFAKGTVGVRALQSIDIAVRHAESFAVMQDAIA
jgi:HK97 family phage major capsid protein